jgi:hypothetical protein
VRQFGWGRAGLEDAVEDSVHRSESIREAARRALAWAYDNGEFDQEQENRLLEMAESESLSLTHAPEQQLLVDWLQKAGLLAATGSSIGMSAVARRCIQNHVARSQKRTPVTASDLAGQGKKLFLRATADNEGAGQYLELRQGDASIGIKALSPTEVAVWKSLVTTNGNPMSVEDLAKELGPNVKLPSIRSALQRLSLKLASLGIEHAIENVRGRGYRVSELIVDFVDEG